MRAYVVEQTAYRGDVWRWAVKVSGREMRSGLARGRKAAWRAARRAEA